MNTAYKLLDSVRGELGPEEGARELVRISLAMRDLGGFPDGASASDARKFGKKVFSLVSDPKWNDSYGFTSFFRPSAERIVSFFESVIEFDEESYERVVREKYRTETGSIDFSPILFKRAVGKLSLKKGQRVVVTNVEACLSIAVELVADNPDVEFHLYITDARCKPILLLLFSEYKNVHLIEGGIDRDFTKPYPVADVVIAFPPPGFRIKDDAVRAEANSRGYLSHSEAMSFAISRFLKEAKVSSTLYCFVIEKFLFGSGEKALRDTLTSEGMLKRVVRLPEGSLAPASGIACNLLHIEKNSNAKGSEVVFCKLTSDKRVRSGWEFTMDDLAGEVRCLPVEEVSELDSYSIDRVFAEEINLFQEDMTTQGLSELSLDIFRGAPTSKLKDGQDAKEVALINYKDIKGAYVDVNQLEVKKVSSSRPLNRYYLQDGDIVLASRGSKEGGIEVSLVKGECGVPVVPSTNLAVIRVDQEKMDPAFLHAFLVSSAGQISLLARQSGATSLLLSTKELGTIEVPLLPLTKQRKLASKLEKARVKYEKAVEAAQDEFQATRSSVLEEMGINI